MQKITIAGNVGKDAVLKQVSGEDVAEFTVAVSNGRDKEPTWYSCTVWGKRSKSVQFTKGTRITLDGRLSTRVYEGKAYLSVNVSDFTLQGGGQRSDSAELRQSGGGLSGGGSAPSSDDDIPF